MSCGTIWCSRSFALMKNMMWHIRSVAGILAEARRTGRQERELPPGKPGKFRVEKTRAHDFEPPACGPRCAAASRGFFAKGTARDGPSGFGSHGMLCRRCRNRVDE